MAKISRMWNSRGQSITEFTLLLPLLLVVIGGSTDFGLGFFASHIAQNAAREGARIAVTLPPPFDNAKKAQVEAAVNSKIPDIYLFSNYTVSVTDPTVNPDTNQLEVAVEVSGTYNFTFLRLIDVFFGTFPTSIDISRGTTMRYEWQTL